MTKDRSRDIPQYNWKTIPPREARPGIVQRGFRGNTVMISYAELHPHMEPGPHSHEAEQIFMLLKGRVKLHVGDQVFDMEEGSIVRIPPNVVHWSEPPRPEDGVAINMDVWPSMRPAHSELVKYQTDEFDSK